MNGEISLEDARALNQAIYMRPRIVRTGMKDGRPVGQTADGNIIYTDTMEPVE